MDVPTSDDLLKQYAVLEEIRNSEDSSAGEKMCATGAQLLLFEQIVGRDSKMTFDVTYALRFYHFKRAADDFMPSDVLVRQGAVEKRLQDIQQVHLRAEAPVLQERSLESPCRGLSESCDKNEIIEKVAKLVKPPVGSEEATNLVKPAAGSEVATSLVKPAVGNEPRQPLGFWNKYPFKPAEGSEPRKLLWQNNRFLDSTKRDEASYSGANAMENLVKPSAAGAHASTRMPLGTGLPPLVGTLRIAGEEQALKILKRQNSGNFGVEDDGKGQGAVVPRPFMGFRTAREELQIQNLKRKNSGNFGVEDEDNVSRGQGGFNLFNYGAVKKSLGARRTVRSNFVPPVRPADSVPRTNGDLMNAETMNSSQPTDERLVNIDPKMIELITNEIMHKFNNVAWEDIAGLEYAKSIIREAVVYPLLRPDLFTGLRRPPRGILLFGPPGTGKTLIGKCIAAHSQSTFFSISASALTSKWVGDGEKMVRALFAVAAVHQPSVIFIDEIDSLLSQRSDTEHESSRRIKTEFLVQLDGAATSDEDRILIVGATNRPQELDEAARRRFTKRLYIPLPESAARLQIINKLLKAERNSLDAQQRDGLAAQTEGFSGADVESLCREASMEPIRSIPPDEIPTFEKDNLRPVAFEDFAKAMQNVRPSVSQGDLKQYLDWNKQYGALK